MTDIATPCSGFTNGSDRLAPQLFLHVVPTFRTNGTGPITALGVMCGYFRTPEPGDANQKTMVVTHSRVIRLDPASLEALDELPRSAHACDEAAIEKAVTRAVGRAMRVRQFRLLSDSQ
jgi:hypothetical protein